MKRAGKTYAITGAASGLGLATTKALHAEGANVALLDRDTKGEEIAAELGERAFFVQIDVTDEKSVGEGFAKIMEKFKALHGCINCAGIGMAMTTIDKKLNIHQPSVFDFIMKLNTYGTFYGSAHAASCMAKCEAAEDGSRGVIINVASVAGIEGQKGQMVYGASKGAVIGMTVPMARDLARYGIRVMTIAPGIIDTPLMRSASPKVQQGLLDQVAAPKRFGHPEEFATLCKAIIDCGYLNGETIRMDGGIRFANL